MNFQFSRKSWLAPILHVQGGSIATALLIRVLLFSTMVTLVLTVVQLVLSYQSEMSRLENRFDEISEVSSRSLGNSLWTLDAKQLQEQLDGILRIPSIRALEVREITSSAHPFVVFRGERQDARSIMKEVPLFCCGEKLEKIGVLRIEATLSDIYSSVASQALVILLSNAVKTFLVALFILFIMHHLMTRHLLDIAASIGGLTHEDNIVPLKLRRQPREDELEQMVNAINTMLKEQHAREQEFRAMVEHSPDAIARYDTQCRRSYVNPALQRLFGLPVAKILGKTPLEHSTMSDAQTHMQRIQQVLKSSQEAQMEFSFCDMQGETRWGHMRLVPEFGMDGAVNSVLAITRDITALKQAEHRLEESRTQLRGLMVRHEDDREEERKHISRELHDELGQIMTALKMNVQMLAGNIGEDLPLLRKQAQQAEAAIVDAIGVVRGLSSSLRPVELDMGIIPALEWAVKRFATFTHIECSLHIEHGEINPDEPRAIALFRIVQESLTNIAKHAQASRVDIALARDADDYVLKVRDNGKGFDTSAKKAGSFGLVGIRERVLMLGGTVAIDSRRNMGTEIVVRIPSGENHD